MPPKDDSKKAPAKTPLSKEDRRVFILNGLRGRDLEQAITDPKLWAEIKEEARSDGADRLVTPEAVALVESIHAQQAADRSLSLFYSTDDVLIIPGFLGSELDDVTKGGEGTVWITPQILTGNTEKLNDLRLKPYVAGKPDRDDKDTVDVRANGAIPLVYGVLKYDLEVRRYSVRIFGVDWRKNLDESALALAKVVKARADQRFRPLHVIAHSQGAIVALRSIQLLGAEASRQLVKNLVLIGPATAGTFSAVTALTGNHSFLELVKRWGITPPDHFEKTLQSMSGLYQLIPWRTKQVGKALVDDHPTFSKPLEWILANREKMAKNVGESDGAFWPGGIDQSRIDAYLGWAERIETSFLNDRTSIILGDQPTVGGVKLEDGRLVEDPAFSTTGDGTVPDALALVDGASRIYKAKDAEHMMLPASISVIAAVRDILAGRQPQVAPYNPLAAAAKQSPFPFLAQPSPEPTPVYSTAARSTFASRQAGDVPPPAFRSLRVFSFDPLAANEIESLGAEQITLNLPWEFADGGQLQPGPIGDYVEVVDCDPASGCVYPPIDLNHPHVLAQSGLPLSEGDPRFHQQMVYAVSMNTILQFEHALGRKALWSPRLERDKSGQVVPPPMTMPFGQQVKREFVQRLRIYPHAMRSPTLTTILTKKPSSSATSPPKAATAIATFPAALCSHASPTTLSPMKPRTPCSTACTGIS